jgi:hypothetical protein
LAAAVDAARQPLTGAVQVKSVTNDLRPDAERAGNQVDAQPRRRHLHDLRQHYLVFRGLSQRHGDVGATESSLTGHCPTVTM